MKSRSLPSDFQGAAAACRAESSADSDASDAQPDRPPTLVVLVCGGRHYNDYDRVRDVLDAVNPACIVHGDAPGADRLADRWARAHGVNVVPFAADWKKHKRAAGPIRNSVMLEAACPDLVIAFPGGAGTDDLVAKAYDANITVWEVK